MPQRQAPSLISTQSKANQLQKAEIKKALEEDPNVFSYDEVYDDMKGSTESSTSSSTKRDVKPKYMHNLLKSAELRKREQESREERKIQKEREEEGDQFADKEAFVTSAYREKLKQLKETEEREKREAECEELLDVKKQKDLSGFYRHFLKQQVGEEKTSTHTTSDRFDTKTSSSSKDDPTLVTFSKSRKTGSRNLRQRMVEESDESESEEKSEDQIQPEASQEQSLPPSTQDAKDQEVSAPSEELIKDEQPESGDVTEEPPIDQIPSPKPIIDRRTLILERFEKRTVELVLEAAIQRYQERKAARSSVQ